MNKINRSTDIGSDLEKQIHLNRIHFSNYNMVRMREALRYLTPKKLQLFIEIPFLIHANHENLPGYVDTVDNACGIWNFESSGFFKEARKNFTMPDDSVTGSHGHEPAVEGLYHIGSLGTFTQSVGSDFDYWAVIDKQKFSPERYDGLRSKLDQIAKYSRETYDQEVTFFIIDRENIKKNSYAGYKSDQSLTAPRIFLKEEFYRTFLMIAGKIPFWAVLPINMDEPSYNRAVTDIASSASLSIFSRDLIDLGNMNPPDYQDILKGLLWHIWKSRSDPVKALIKASMIFSYGFGSIRHHTLLCEIIKEGYNTAGIDDYSVDPYRVLFDRIIEFYEEMDPGGLGLIKNAVFFRLCGFPSVTLPEKGSPKRQLLNRYIRRWNLKPAQIQKLLRYNTWSEHEKLLLEDTLLRKLKDLYDTAKDKIKGSRAVESETADEKRNWDILKNMTQERLNRDPAKIPAASVFLRREKFDALIVTPMPESGEWLLYTRQADAVSRKPVYRNNHLLGIVGFIMENRLYNRKSASIKIEGNSRLFRSGPDPVDPDILYLDFMPLKPMDDVSFRSAPVWMKTCLLLIYRQTAGVNLLTAAEILAANSWGELYLSSVDLDCIHDEEKRCDTIARTVKKYEQAGSAVNIFQFSLDHDPDIVYKIKLSMGYHLTINQKARELPSRRPYLDRL